MILIHSPIVLLQDYSQLKKLCRQNPIPDPEFQRPDGNTSVRSSMTGSAIGTHYDRMSLKGMIIPPKHKSFFYNLRNVFAYKPQSQEYLYQQLFEDSVGRQSASGSLIFNHMQVVDELRMNETGS